MVSSQIIRSGWSITLTLLVAAFAIIALAGFPATSNALSLYEDPFKFTATPASGTAPLTVTFNAVNPVANVSTYYVSFGDGTDGKMEQLACLGGCFPNPITTSHTYTAPGTYTVQLSYSTICPVGQGCAAVLQDAATITVTVSAHQSDYAFTATPRSGAVPLQVDFSALMGDEQSGSVDFGDGESANMSVSGGGEKRAVTHTYKRPGRYTAKLTVKSIIPSGTTIEDDVESVRITVREEGDEDEVIEKLQKQIDELKALLEELLKKKGSGAFSANLNCPLFTRTLALGMSDSDTGGDITRLQVFLRSTGDYTYPEITGYFGVETERAVQRWQARNGIVSSGTPETTGYGAVGPKTQAAMARCGQ